MRKPRVLQPTEEEAREREGKLQQEEDERQKMKAALRMSEAEWAGFNALEGGPRAYGVLLPQEEFLFAITRAERLHSDYGVPLCEDLREAIMRHHGVIL
jgi:hypothetical protein